MRPVYTFYTLPMLNPTRLLKSSPNPVSANGHNLISYVGPGEVVSKASTRPYTAERQVAPCTT